MAESFDSLFIGRDRFGQSGGMADLLAPRYRLAPPLKLRRHADALLRRSKKASAARGRQWLRGLKNGRMEDLLRLKPSAVKKGGIVKVMKGRQDV